MSDDNIVKACKLGVDVIAVEVYVWCADGTVDWLPSIHVGRVDFDEVEKQIREHHAHDR